jgi:hypothetical protein
MSNEYDLPIHRPSDKCPACGSDDIWGGETDNGIYVAQCMNSSCRYNYIIRTEEDDDET